MGRRLKGIALVAVVAASGLALLAWSRAWFRLELVAGPWPPGPSEVAGSVASPALSALALAGLALAAALALAGPVIRVILGILGALLGACIVLAASLSLADPAGAVLPAVTGATGVAGTPARELVAAVDATVWPGVAIAGGVLLALAGVFVAATGSRWPASSRKYRSARFEPAADDTRNARDRAVDDWDELSRGDDPTDAGGRPE